MFTINLHAIESAREAVAGQVVQTPLVPSKTLSRIAGSDLLLKFENLQFTSSFKERGALNKLLTLTEQERTNGVIAASAGNHAQAVARHAARLQIPTHIVMPRYTPNTKVENTSVFGAEITLKGNHVVDSLAYVKKVAADRELTVIHPFDDSAVVAGQGTIGLELLEQCPNLDTVVVPIGGGGLIAGIASALKQIRMKVKVIGVQMEDFNAASAGFHHVRTSEPVSTMTVAEGIAVKSPGELTQPIIEELVDDIVEVSERDAENAIFSLLEIEKTVVEGAGAVALAAVLRHPQIARGKTALILSGGNIDMFTLSSVLHRGLVRSSRLVRIAVEIPDIPGSLAKLAKQLGELDSNIVEIDHRRVHKESTIGAMTVDVMLHLCGEEQADKVLHSLSEHGYHVELHEI